MKRGKSQSPIFHHSEWGKRGGGKHPSTVTEEEWEHKNYINVQAENTKIHSVSTDMERRGKKGEESVSISLDGKKWRECRRRGEKELPNITWFYGGEKGREKGLPPLMKGERREVPPEESEEGD